LKKTSILLPLFLLLFVPTAGAECLFDCLFQPGTTCVNGVCVSTPTVTPAPTPSPAPAAVISEIRIESKPGAEIVTLGVDCSNIDMKNFKIWLKRKFPPPFCSFYSSIFYFSKDMSGNDKMVHFYAQKDLLNRYVFLFTDPAETPKAQFFGTDFVFNQLENKAFNDFLATKTCEELKVSNLFFSYGISVKGDRSDYEGAIFTFR
jgi:hypothetical protein